MWQLAILTSLVWFTGGIVLSAVNILTGYVADRTQRGKSFSLMSLGTPLGALLGGLTASQLIAWQGYPLTFMVLSVSWLLIPLAASQLDPVPVNQKPARAQQQQSYHALARPFYLFVPVFLLSTIAVSIGRLGTSLSMQALMFSPSAVASTASISGLVALPVILWVGRLSDHIDRRNLLVFTYILSAAGVVLLANAFQLWHFWLAATLLLIARAVNGAVGSAYVTDILAPQELARGLSWLNTIGWAAGVVTFAGTGHMVGAVGLLPVYMFAGIAAVAAAIQLEWLGCDYRPKEAIQSLVEDVRQIMQDCVCGVRVDGCCAH